MILHAKSPFQKMNYVNLFVEKLIFCNDVDVNNINNNNNNQWNTSL